MISQIIAEVQLNISSNLEKFQIFIKKVCQKEWTQNFKKRKNNNNYFTPEISKKEPPLLRLKVNQKIEF